MKKNIYLFFLLIIFQTLDAQNSTDPKKFVSCKDVFGTRNFIENKGQFDGDLTGDFKIEAVLNHGLEKIYFTNKGLVYELIKRFPVTEEQREEMEKGKDPKLKEPKIYYVNMNWLNVNPNISVEKSEKQSHYFTYGEAKYNSYAYKKLTYKNVYPNVDVEYTIPKDKDYGIKYNVIVHPGANVADIKIAYTGDVEKIELSKEGNVLIKTPLDDIVEHVPKSFYGDGTVLESTFILNKDVIGFNLSKGYNQSKTVIIDPWVSSTSIIGYNLAFDVDYDCNGNTYVYGGGSNIASSFPNQVALYNFNGILQWSFSGTLTIPPWDGGGAYAGNFVVDKLNGKTYVTQGFALNAFFGAQTIRLDALGNYDNFISSPPNPDILGEMMDMGYRELSGDIYGFGGGAQTNHTAKIIDKITGACLVSSLHQNNPDTFYTVAQLDITSHAFDNAGNLFVLYGGYIPLPTNENFISLANSNFIGYSWLTATSFSVFTEIDNKAGYVGMSISATSGGGFNALAANDNYLFYYNGFNLVAHSKANGASLAFTTVPSLILRQQGGIAVDDCNNVYVGGNGFINCYHFNGTNFNPIANIPLGASGPNQYVFDIKLDKANQVLHVSGSSFVGTYSAINSLTCSSTSSSSVCYFNPPAQNFTICEGQNVTLTPTINPFIINPSYSLQPGGLSNTMGSFVVSPSVTTGYTVFISGTNIYSNAIIQAAVFSVTVYPQTLLSSLTTTQTTCSNSLSAFSLGLSFNPVSASPEYTVNWLPSIPNGISSYSQTSASGYIAADVYTAAVTDGTCLINIIFTINPQPVPPVVITKDTATCIGEAFALMASGGLSYNWSGPGNFASTNQNPVLTNAQLNMAGVYTVIVAAAGSCTNSGISSVVIHTLPTVPDIITTGPVCMDRLLLLHPEIRNSSSSLSYSWQGPDDFLSNTPSIAIEGNSTNNGGIYYLTVKNSNNCTATTSAIALFYELPVVNILAKNNKGCGSVCAIYNIQTSITNTLVNWFYNNEPINNKLTALTKCFLEPGLYELSVMVIDTNGCLNTAFNMAEVYPKPIADFNYVPAEPVFDIDDFVNFKDASLGNGLNQWKWYFLSTLKPFSSQQNPIYTYPEPGNYLVTLVINDKMGCSDSVSKPLVVIDDFNIFVPSSFSPNGDTKNDTFQPKGTGIATYDLSIYDRWGEEVFRTTNFLSVWDGSYKGELCKSDVYVWKIRATSFNKKTKQLIGHVVLMR
jgi:gliding motility-associated-like protein